MGPVLALLLLAAPAPAEPVVADVTLRDEARGKDLEVRVVHPASGGPHPLIVFSHGAGGSREGVTELGRAWAAGGYVVVAPTHADSVELRRQQGETATLRGAVSRAMTPEALEGRVRDIRFLLDSLELLEEKLPALRGRIERKAIGMAGHSMGALTGQALAGVRTAGGADLSDRRPIAFLLLSPQGENRLLGPDAWAELKRPTMFMSGTQDRGVGGQPPEWRREPYEKSPPGDKYLVWIEGATHMSFTGRLAGVDFSRAAARLQGQGRPGEPGPRLDANEQKEVWDTICRASLAFWDAFLRKDAKAKAGLASLADALAGQAEVKSK